MITPQIDNNISPDTETKIVPSKTYKLITDVSTTTKKYGKKKTIKKPDILIVSDAGSSEGELNLEISGSMQQETRPYSDKEAEGEEIVLNDVDSTLPHKFTKISGNTYQKTREEEKGKTVEGESLHLTDVEENKIAKLTLEGNSIQDGEPSPEFQSPIRNCGDNVNLFSLGNEQKTYRGVEINVNGSEFELNGTTTLQGYLIADTNSNNKYLGKFKTGTYYFTSKLIKGNFEKPKGTFANYIRDKKDNSTIKQWSSSFDTEIEITLEEDTELLYELYVNSANINFNNCKVQIKLEKGTKATPYSEYGCGNINTKVTDNAEQQQSKTFPLEEGQVLHLGDYLADDGIKQIRYTLVLNGTETFHLTEANTNNRRFDMNIVNYYNDEKLRPKSGRDNALSSHFSERSYSNTAEWGKYDIRQDGFLIINDNNSHFTTLEEFKNWLKEQYEAGTPVTIEYTLQEEIITPYTEAQQKVYDELQNLNLYSPITDIYSEDEVQPKLKLQYNYLPAMPSPEAPSEIRNVGDNGTFNIKITDNKTQEQSISFPLSEGQVLHIGDYLAEDGIHQVRKTREFDGTENWNAVTTIGFVISIAEVKKGGKVMSNYFSNNNNKNKDLYIESRSGGNANGLHVSYKNAPTLKEFKAQLTQWKEQGKPLLVEYELTEEIITPYTPAQQKAYNELNEINFYDNTTYIISEDEIKPSNYNIKYNIIYEKPSIMAPSPLIEVNKINITIQEQSYDLDVKLRKIDDIYDTLEWDKLTRRIGYIENYTDEDVGDKWLSTTGELSQGATVWYVLNEPKEETIELPFNKDIKLILGSDNVIKLTANINQSNNISITYYDKENIKIDFSLCDRIMEFADSIDAIKQAIYHILNVERYSCLIYDDNYGVELQQYIGKDFSFLETTIEDTLKEALTQDERILDVVVDNITKIDKDKVNVEYTVICNKGKIQMEVDINV